MVLESDRDSQNRIGSDREVTKDSHPYLQEEQSHLSKN